MLTVLLGVSLVLHGLVHLLYAGQSLRFLELRSGLVWPDGSWAFSRLLGDETARLLASVPLGLIALGFIASGLVLLLSPDWWRPLTVSVTLLSTAVFVLHWDATSRALSDQGGVAILINLAILAAVLVVRWPL
jgi:hypothetical protein